MTVTSTGDKQWRNKDGELHPEDGPAVELADGLKIRFRNGKRHREDGPAVECADGTKEWWRDGTKLPQGKSWLFRSTNSSWGVTKESARSRAKRPP